MSVRQNTFFTNDGSWILPPYEAMTIGQTLRSPNGRFTLRVQDDSNVAIYDGSNAVWVANLTAPYSYQTYNKKYKTTCFYHQYTLTLEDALQDRTWYSHNSDAPYSSIADNNYVFLQDDGNLVSVGFTALWASNTSIPLIAMGEGVLLIPPGTSLVQGQGYTCGDNTLIFQADGNLVLYGKNSTVLWASYTQDKGAVSAVMQDDGNFVIYASNGTPLWHTHTAGNPGAYLQVQSTGSIVLARNDVNWARFGYTPVNKPVKVIYPDDGHSISYTWSI